MDQKVLNQDSNIKNVDAILIDEYKIVYTQTKMSHRFLRVSVDPEDIDSVIEFVNAELSLWQDKQGVWEDEVNLDQKSI